MTSLGRLEHELGADGQHRVTKASPEVTLSKLVLGMADRRGVPWLTLDGRFVGFCGTHVYRETERLHEGLPVFELVHGEPL